MTVFSKDNAPRVRHKRILFPFTAADRDSARLFLNRMAAEGSMGFAHTPAGREAVFPTYESVELGFDESWLSNVDGVNSLIIRQGNTVLIPEGRIDFTAPDVLALLREEVSS